MCEEMDIIWAASKIGISILGLCVPILVGGILSIIKTGLNPGIKEVECAVPPYVPSHIRGTSTLRKNMDITRMLRKMQNLEVEMSLVKKENLTLRITLLKIKNNVEDIFSIIKKGGRSALRKSIDVLQGTYRMLSEYFE
jgi:hypothetical protein